MRIEIDDNIMNKLLVYFKKHLGYDPNKEDLLSEIENIIIEFLEGVK